MNPEQLAYWLQGFCELNPQPPTAAQWQSIREHVASVFSKETPPVREPRPLAPARLKEIADLLHRPIEEDGELSRHFSVRPRRRLPQRLIC